MSKVEWFLVFSTILGLVFASGDVLSASNDECVLIEMRSDGTVITVRAEGDDTAEMRWTTDDDHYFRSRNTKLCRGRMAGDIEVAKGDTVDGSVVTVLGDILCMGVIRGDAVAFGGDVVVMGTGVIEGDAVSFGGRVIRLKNGKVRGEVAAVTFKFSKYASTSMGKAKRLGDES